jgi:hypothetical protein
VKFIATAYGLINLLAIAIVNHLSDLPVWIGNWESKAILLTSFQNPQSNFYPPGGAILLSPFLWIKPNYEIAVFFYFTIASVLYFLICNKIIKNKMILIIALSALTLNPYLLWLVNSSQDTVFELFLLMCGFSLLLAKRFFIFLLPLYLLCLTRPAYWSGFLVLPILIYYFSIKTKNNLTISSKLIFAPLFFLVCTFGINQAVFGSPALAGEAGMTAHFGHNKNWYLAMPKFDSDVFLSTGGNMNTEMITSRTKRFTQIDDQELRAALIYIVENPKSVFLNTLQKLDTYFFAVQKNPQLSGEYYLAKDQKSIVIGENRDSWLIIFGSFVYFIYRSLLLILLIASITILIVLPKLRKSLIHEPQFLMFVPYLFGSISAILFFTETRYKIVSELLLVPLVLSIFDIYKSSKSQK